MKEKILEILEKPYGSNEELADEICEIFEKRRLKRNVKITQIVGSAKGLSGFRNMSDYSEEGLEEGLLKIEELGNEFLNCKE